MLTFYCKKLQAYERLRYNFSSLDLEMFTMFWYFADRASIYIYVNINQLDALNFMMSLFHASTCFQHLCSISAYIQPVVSSHLYVWW